MEAFYVQRLQPTLNNQLNTKHTPLLTNGLTSLIFKNKQIFETVF